MSEFDAIAYERHGKITSYWQQRRPRNKDETADW